MLELCLSPICNNAIEPTGENWRRTPKKYCSEQCKTDTWAIRKAAELLSGFPTEKKIEILNAVSSHNQCEINGNNHCEITVENHHETIMRKAYVCRTWPQLNIGKVRFRNGLFETSDPELQRLIERAHGFGVHIQELRNHMEPKDFEEAGN
jgi:hypothetical protein